MNRRYLFVLNPISGEGDDRKEVIALLSQQLHGIDLEVWETTGNRGDAQKIKGMLSEGNWDGLLVGGGDGTVKMVVEAAIGNDLPFGIIPLGSANGLATCFGIHSISDACHAILKGRTRAVDLWKINDEVFVHLSDFGFNAGLVKRSRDESSRGMMTYFKSSFAQFAELKPYHFTLKFEDEIVEVEAKMLVIANGGKYGTGALINPQGKVDDGLFEIVVLNPEGFEEILRLSIDMFKGTLADSEVVKIWSADKVEISNPDGADFQIDGEVMPKTAAIKVYPVEEKINFYCLE
ncbi:YegS/Rv2252/BmrU family lipid kinase [Echinicola marina]|uniref:diacylglycerol/lipid kinase family protein n=1 Tax=Echinicola marina TaxID=2859768 RepID=UPI001CF6CC9F|nr:YegS/Rv2252/BmrU family lipid kinase [Echinicola marina]UCS95581.1 YegS/Rv2252/BmrU family lipid kinase [Echinicola marina]